MENTVMTVTDSDNNKYEVYIKTGPKDSFEPLNINSEDIPLSIRQTNHPDGLIFVLQTQGNDSLIIRRTLINGNERIIQQFKKKDIILMYKGRSE